MHEIISKLSQWAKTLEKNERETLKCIVWAAHHRPKRCLGLCVRWANFIGIKWTPSYTLVSTRRMICSHCSCAPIKLKEKLCMISGHTNRFTWRDRDTKQIYVLARGNESPIRILASSSCVRWSLRGDLPGDLPQSSVITSHWHTAFFSGLTS